MGQKVNPIGLRVGFIKDWSSRWFADKKSFVSNLHEDVIIRKFIKKEHAQAAVSKIDIERAGTRVKVFIHTARPGIIIGRRGCDVDRLRNTLEKITGKQVFIDICEVKNPAIEAQLISENVAFQLEKRVSFRRAIKRAIRMAIESGIDGIKIGCAGRLGGAEMSRRETYKEGTIPLHTFRADIDYGFAEAHTTAGNIGVKTWVYKGEVLPDKQV